MAQPEFPAVTDSMLTAEDVIAAYRFILGREPEDETVVEHYRRIAPDRETLRNIFFESSEYQQTRGKPEKPAVIHLHVPKTAGSTINRVLVENYQGRNIYNYHDHFLGHGQMADFFQLDEEVRYKIDLFFGHARHGVHKFLRGNCVYVFCLREPYSRIQSLFHYITRSPGHEFHDRAARHSFGEFLEQYESDIRLHVLVDNAQVMQISGFSPLHGPVDYEQALRAACRVAFADNTIFGLTENAAELFERMIERGIIQFAPDYRENSASKNPQLPDAISQLSERQREILDRYTYYDRIFFDICSTYLKALR
jgi:hypothetical protein